MATEVKELYPLAPVDDVLEKVGLPKTRPLLKAVSPHNVLTNKLGITPPGEVLEAIVEDIDRKAPHDGFPRPPGLPKLPGIME